jgi:Caudovirus prohead serine protease
MTVLDDYETMTQRRDLEDAERGYSIGRFGGQITRIDHRSPPREKPSGKYSDAPKVLQGFACLYNVIHSHKGRKEMFATNCFEGSLFSVMCHVDHNLLSKQLGDQDDGSLELFDSEIGLAFRLKISASDLDRLQGRDQMSVMYRENVVDVQSIGSDSVRVIKSASLVEVSAVHAGAVKNTFAVVRDATKVGRLIEDATRSFPSDSALAGIQRAISRLGTL